MNQTNLVGTIMRSVANADLPPLERYPLADQVTFKYYTGILAFFEEKYQKVCFCAGAFFCFGKM